MCTPVIRFAHAVCSAVLEFSGQHALLLQLAGASIAMTQLSNRCENVKVRYCIDTGSLAGIGKLLVLTGQYFGQYF